MTYHYRPGIRPRHFFLGYWHLGEPGNPVSTQVLGLTHVWRSRRAFTAQLGIGARLRSGDEWNERLGDTPLLLLYSIGSVRTVKTIPEGLSLEPGPIDYSLAGEDEGGHPSRCEPFRDASLPFEVDALPAESRS